MCANTYHPRLSNKGHRSYASCQLSDDTWWGYVHPSYGGSKQIVIHGSNLQIRLKKLKNTTNGAFWNKILNYKYLFWSFSKLDLCEGGSFSTAILKKDAIFNSDIQQQWHSANSRFRCYVCPFVALLKTTYAEKSHIVDIKKTFICNLLCIDLFSSR